MRWDIDIRWNAGSFTQIPALKILPKLPVLVKHSARHHTVITEDAWNARRRIISSEHRQANAKGELALPCKALEGTDLCHDQVRRDICCGGCWWGIDEDVRSIAEDLFPGWLNMIPAGRMLQKALSPGPCSMGRPPPGREAATNLSLIVSNYF